MSGSTAWAQPWVCTRCRRSMAEPGDDDGLCRGCRMAVDRIIAAAQAGHPRSADNPNEQVRTR